MLSLKKKLADLKESVAKMSEEKSPAKNKKTGSTKMQKQNTRETKVIDVKEKQPAIHVEGLPKVMDMSDTRRIKL